MSRLICLELMRIQLSFMGLMPSRLRDSLEEPLVLLTMLIAIFYSSNALARSDCQCDDPIASVVFERLDRSSNRAKIRITNAIDEDICFELGHGPRGFRLIRAGRSIPINGNLPFISPQDRCLALQPGETTTEEYEIDRFFPPLRPQDELCFDARVRVRAQQDSENMVITSCQIIE